MKKIIALLLAVAMLFALAACGSADTSSDNSGKEIKVGFIFLHDETSTYDLNFINGAKAAQKALGLKDSQVVFKTMIPESKECYDAAADLVDQGCNVVFADSFGHEEWIIKAAKEFKDVQFCHATGVKAHTEKLDNYHNAFASIYEGRYLAGVAAGMKIKEMIDNGTITEDKANMGYVGAFPYAEVISGYTSFFLGAKSVVPSVTMNVDFTNSWYDPDAERDVANSLIDKGAVLISQHADSMGAPKACEAKNVPNVSYNGSTLKECPNTFVVSSRINWEPYFKYMIQSVMDGKAIDTDWTGTLANEAVQLTEVNEAVAAKGTVEAIADVKEKLINKEISVFDTKNFTVEGKTLESYLADVDDMGDFVPETEVIENGVFCESTKRSAPYFDANVDGITRLDKQN